MTDLHANPRMHPFLKQKGYQAIAGDTRLSATEIEYLLTLQNSSQALKDFVLGRQYVDHLATAAGSQLVFKSKYRPVWRRRLLKTWYLFLYCVFYTLGFSPLLFPIFGISTPSKMPLTFIFTAALFFPAGFFMLKAGVRIARAEALVKNQHHHTQAVVLAHSPLQRGTTTS
ncbi:hypothetical protein [Azohydromonas caseinilytica]|uniref:Uncharacterized protein n=1 Tax=Azohydromonas caseinilytica TaxID=2728836 RepID=A0A848F313_9BURK|nr:hypothetical protein [Azohydromonas caseinilytica]NML13428.1 hypothetical protein [Azohydromonas caseinilytica]